MVDLSGIRCAYERINPQERFTRKGSFVPMPFDVLERVLDFFTDQSIIRPYTGQFLFDAGSGDGRTVFSAEQYGINGEGMEDDSKLVMISKAFEQRFIQEGLLTRRSSRIRQGDYLEETNFRRYDVVTWFLDNQPDSLSSVFASEAKEGSYLAIVCSAMYPLKTTVQLGLSFITGAIVLPGHQEGVLRFCKYLTIYQKSSNPVDRSLELFEGLPMHYGPIY